MAHLPRFPILVLVSVFVFVVVGVHVPSSHAGPLPPTYDGSMCSESSMCGDVEIKYPFYFADATEVTLDHKTTYSCGYTDLKIFCQDYGGVETAFIQLSQYNYTVKRISYDENKTILVADADASRRGNDGCPVVLHNVSFGTDWLRYEDSSHDNLTFFLGCYPDGGDRMPEGFEPYHIVCPKFSKPVGIGATLVFSSEQQAVAQEHDVAEHCREIFVAPVLRDSLYGPNKPMLSKEYGNVLSNGFELEWYPMTTDRQCHSCQESGGRCAYNQNKAFLGCLCVDGKVGKTNCSNSDASSTPPTLSSKSLRN